MTDALSVNWQSYEAVVDYAEELLLRGTYGADIVVIQHTHRGQMPERSYGIGHAATAEPWQEIVWGLDTGVSMHIDGPMPEEEWA
tara:strand:+ start:749 stop:1003 length:255 start_codon:yes stop_codon:yes gene_type:complete